MSTDNKKIVRSHIQEIRSFFDECRFFQCCWAGSLFLLLVYFCGCANASYSPRAAPTLSVSSMRAQQTEKDVEVAIDPYIGIEKQRTVFDEDMANEGVIPVCVLVTNRSSRTILVRQSDVQLVVEEGGILLPISPRDASIQFEKSTASGAAIGTTVVGTLVGGPIVGTIAGSMVGQSAEKKNLEASTNRLNDFNKKGLRDAKLAPQDSTQGFVYFNILDKKIDFTKTLCTIRIIDFEEATSSIFRFQLANDTK